MKIDSENGQTQHILTFVLGDGVSAVNVLVGEEVQCRISEDEWKQ